MSQDAVAELEAIKQWLFDNHSHHVSVAEEACEDDDHPYVDSLALEAHIDARLAVLRRPTTEG